MDNSIRITTLHHRDVPMTRENEEAYAARDKPRFGGNVACSRICSLCEGEHCWMLGEISPEDANEYDDMPLDLHNAGGVVWGCRHCGAWMETTPDCCCDDEHPDLLWHELHTVVETCRLCGGQDPNCFYAGTDPRGPDLPTAARRGGE